MVPSGGVRTLVFYVALAVRFVLPVPARAVGSAETVSPAEHPLMPVLRIAYDAYDRISREVRDYTCVLVKREHVGRRLTSYQYMFAKVRHEEVEDQRVVVPFSVYLRFLAPTRIRDREVLYVRGQNGGKLIARKGGTRFSYVKVELDPESEAAMRDNRYPITELGVQNLLKRLIQAGEDEIKQDVAADECEVKFFHQAKVEGRLCTSVQIRYPVRHEQLRFHLVRVYMDDELHVPIRYEAYDFPEMDGGPPRLLEEYTYLNLRLNVGLTDADFRRSALDVAHR